MLRWFSLTGAISIAIFSVIMALVLSRFVTKSLVERDAEVSAAFVQSIVEVQNVGDYLLMREPGKFQKDALEFFAHLAGMPEVLRANVYGIDNMVIWSSKAEMIGKRYQRNDELDQALAGAVVANIESGDDEHKDEHVAFDDPKLEFVEYYLPVRHPNSKQLIAVIEIYKKPHSLWAAAAAGRRLVWAVALGGGLFLYLSLLGLIVRADRAMAEQHSKLIEAEGMAFVGEMSAAVAHSIRNPLASIRSTAELSAEINEQDSEPQRDIIRQVDRIDSLLRTLLTYSRVPTEAGASADLHEVLNDAVGRFAPDFAARHIRLDFKCAPVLPRVRGDGALFKQVLYSVLSNALEATDKDDWVIVSALSDSSRRFVNVAVIDSGRGIESSHVPQVFKPFFTTKSRGLGLGLALVRRIVTRFGGKVELNSTAGRGTSVRLSLPVA